MANNTGRKAMLLLLGMLGLPGLTGLAHLAYQADWRLSFHGAERRAEVAAKDATLRERRAVAPAEPAAESAALEPAQSGGSYNITQSVVAGGGGVSTNGATRLEGTLGQTTTAISSGGSYTLSSGFVNSTCPAVSLTTASLPNGTVNSPYNQTLTATGGTAPYTFSLGAGSLPSGITLSNAGALSGTPLQSGTFNLTINATDSQNCSGSRAYTLTIDCQTITVNPASLLAGRQGLPYSQSFTQTGGVGAVSFALTGTLPTGLSFNTATAVLSGIPTALGSFNFTVTATDAAGCSGQRVYTLVVLRRGVVKADFDGDGKTDLSVFRPSAVDPTPNWLALSSLNGQAVNFSWGGGYAPYFDVPVPGDYDGDGKADYAIWRGADTFWYLRRSSDSQPVLVFYGANFAPYFDIPTPGDFDGDGKTDIAVFRRSGTWFVRRSSDGGDTIVNHGQTGDIPLAADFDGDGKCDFGLFRPDAVAPTPNWIILQSSTNTVVSLQWGGGYAPYFDTPVPADYDGDGKADLAIWRGADSIWYIRPSATPNNPILDLWGANYAPYNDIPTPGDYDGDGKADIAVFRRTGTWFVKRSSNGTNLIQDQGQAGDVPLPANGVR